MSYYIPSVRKTLFPLSYAISELGLNRYRVLLLAKSGELKPVAKLPGGMLLYEWRDIQKVKECLRKER